MVSHTRALLRNPFAGAVLLLLPAAMIVSGTASAQGSGNTVSAQSTSTARQNRWLHVRVENPGGKDEIVRVNVPLELAERVLPTIDRDRLHHGKVRVDQFDCHGVDLPALLDAVRASKDGEFVTVQSNDADIRVAKQNSYFLVHVIDKNHAKKARVEVKVPMKVVEALLSSGKDELDLVAGLHALSTQGDTELVSVKDERNTVRVWLDSKNVSD